MRNDDKRQRLMLQIPGEDGTSIRATKVHGAYSGNSFLHVIWGASRRSYGGFASRVFIRAEIVIDIRRDTAAAFRRFARYGHLHLAASASMEYLLYRCTNIQMPFGHCVNT